MTKKCGRLRYECKIKKEEITGPQQTVNFPVSRLQRMNKITTEFLTSVNLLNNHILISGLG